MPHPFPGPELQLALPTKAQRAPIGPARIAPRLGLLLDARLKFNLKRCSGGVDPCPTHQEPGSEVELP